MRGVHGGEVGGQRVAAAEEAGVGACTSCGGGAAAGTGDRRHVASLRDLREHVLTECDGTGGRSAFAGDMRDQAEVAKAAMAGEAHPAPARAAAQLAVEGWAAAARGTPVAPSKWRAMRALLGGILPQWKDSKGDTCEQRDRAKAVARSVATMQTLAADRVKAHRKRAAKAVQWVRDREQARPMLQLMLRAWEGVARTTAAARVAGAPMLGPEDRILDGEQYVQAVEG